MQNQTEKFETSALPALAESRSSSVPLDLSTLLGIDNDNSESKSEKELKEELQKMADNFKKYKLEINHENKMSFYRKAVTLWNIGEEFAVVDIISSISKNKNHKKLISFSKQLENSLGICDVEINSLSLKVKYPAEAPLDFNLSESLNSSSPSEIGYQDTHLSQETSAEAMSRFETSSVSASSSTTIFPQQNSYQVSSENSEPLIPQMASQDFLYYFGNEIINNHINYQNQLFNNNQLAVLRGDQPSNPNLGQIQGYGFQIYEYSLWQYCGTINFG